MAGSSGRIHGMFDQVQARAAEAERAGEEAAGTVLRSVGRAREAMHDVGDVASDMASTAVDGARHASRAVVRQVEEQPLAALAVLGVAAFALGWMMRGSGR